MQTSGLPQAGGGHVLKNAVWNPISRGHVVQFAGQAQRHRMISQREGKSFIFCFALWGTAKVVCGYLLLLTVINFWGHTYPFDITLLEIATSLSFITSGKCTIAFAYFRGKASRLVLPLPSCPSSLLFGCFYSWSPLLKIMTTAKGPSSVSHFLVSSWMESTFSS